MSNNEEEKVDGIEVSYDVMPNLDSANRANPETKPVAKSWLGKISGVDNSTKDPVNDVDAKSPNQNPEPSNSPASQLLSGISGLKNLPYKRIVIILLAVIILGVGGYFGFIFFLKDNNVVDLENNQPVDTDEQPELPVAWLESNFESNCDPTVCGANADPDGDSLSNFEELNSLTNPNEYDTDYDGIADADEIKVYNTEPRMADTDGDGFEDGIEIRNGFSPNSASSQKASVLELQIFDENIVKYGLAHSTKRFLEATPYISNFDLGENTQQVYLSLPKGWSYASGPEKVEALESIGAGSYFVIKFEDSENPDATITLDTYLVENPEQIRTLLETTISDYDNQAVDLELNAYASVYKINVSDLILYISEVDLSKTGEVADSQVANLYGVTMEFIVGNQKFSLNYSGDVYDETKKLEILETFRSVRLWPF